jgi:hypothetical protein
VPAHAVGHDVEVDLGPEADVILVVSALAADDGQPMRRESDAAARGGLGHVRAIITIESGR